MDLLKDLFSSPSGLLSVLIAVGMFLAIPVGIAMVVAQVRAETREQEEKEAK